MQGEGEVDNFILATRILEALQFSGGFTGCTCSRRALAAEDWNKCQRCGKGRMWEIAYLSAEGRLWVAVYLPTDGAP